MPYATNFTDAPKWMGIRAREVPLTGLTGIPRTHTGIMVPNPTPRRMLEGMKFYKAATTASDHGSITVWRDDRGHLHGERHVHMCVKDQVHGGSMAYLTAWLKTNLPLI